MGVRRKLQTIGGNKHNILRLCFLAEPTSYSINYCINSQICCLTLKKGVYEEKIQNSTLQSGVFLHEKSLSYINILVNKYICFQ